MGLRDEVTAATKRPTVPKWEQVRAALTDDEWVEFLECLDDRAVPALALVKVLRTRDVPISDATINSWRRTGGGTR